MEGKGLQLKALAILILLAFCLTAVESRCTKGCKETVKRNRRSVDFMAYNRRADDPRLPNRVIPFSYRLHLRPSFDESQFHGRVWIGFTVSSPTNTITFHARRLDIEPTSITVTKVHGSNNNITSDFQARLQEYDKEREFYTVRLSPGTGGPNLETGNRYELHMSFYGTHTRKNNRLEGFYRDFYVEPKTKERRWFAVTHLSPANARQVFPCFDEPSMKATFEISVARPSHLSALSNMPVRTSEVMVERNGWFWDHFEKSPPMAPSSVAIIISDFVPRQDEQSQSGHHRRRPGAPPSHPASEFRLPQPGTATVTVWASQAIAASVTNAAAIAAPKILSFFERYLETPFPLPKVDLVAIPALSSTWPAHNWGLIFFRESDLFSETSGAEKWVASRIATELAYQWVGCYTTPAWWTDAWINKALANYLSAVAMEEIYEKNNQAANLKSPFSLVYSLYYEYSKPSPYTRILSIKDLVFAEKGEMVIRMLNNTLTERTFRSALKDFFVERQFGTFVDDDLWNIMTRRAHADNTLPADATVKMIADSWIDKDRFPVVTITRDYDAGTADIEQRMFIRSKAMMPEYQDMAERSNEESKLPLWWVPIVMATQEKMNFGETSPVRWMKPTERRVVIERDEAKAYLPGPKSFIVVNPEEIGFFFVNYDRKNWALLANYLDRPNVLESVPEVTRAKLVHDALNLALGDELAFDVALDVTRFLRRDRSPAPWKPVFYMMDYLQRQLDGTSAGKKFADYVIHLVSPLYEELTQGDRRRGMEDDSGMPTSTEITPGWKTRLRSNARHALCSAGHTPCITASKAQFDAWMNSSPRQGIPIPVQSLCPVFGYGTKAEWRFGLETVLRSDEDKPWYGRVYLLKTLASCTRDSYLIESLLQCGLRETNLFNDEELRLILSMMTSSYNGSHTLFKYLRDNWGSLKIRFENKPQMWNSLISSATGAFKTQEGYDMVYDLFQKHKGEFGTAEVIVIQSLKKIKAEARWNERNLPVIESWLNSYLRDKKDIKSLK